MSDAAKVQRKPVVTAESKDVFDDLRVQHAMDGSWLLDDDITGRLAARIDFGQRKYGSRLMTHNGRDVLLDIEQELLDGIQYSHQGVMEGHRVAHIRNRLIDAVKALRDYRKAIQS